MRPEAARRSGDAPLWIVAMVAIPPGVGVTVALKWTDTVNDDFYSMIAQVIATLFVAVAVDFWGGGPPGSRAITGGAYASTRTRGDPDFFTRVASERRPYKLVALPFLVFLGWIGFFACVRALAAHSTWLTVGAAAAGVTATEVLTLLFLHDRILRSSQESKQKKGALVLVYLSLLAPVFVLSFP